jgi:flavorubredoxin
MFDDLVGNYDEAFRYYFDVILRPYSKYMLKAIEKIRQLEIQSDLHRTRPHPQIHLETKG